MANILQQKKRNKTNIKRKIYNSSFKSSTKTIIKKYKKAIETKEKEQAKLLLSQVYKKLDKGFVKGIFHKNFSNRKKAFFTNLLNNL